MSSAFSLVDHNYFFVWNHAMKQHQLKTTVLKSIAATESHADLFCAKVVP